MRAACLALTLAALAVGLVGCGQADSPKAVYERMWRAAENGDRAACLACYSQESRALMLELEKTAADLSDDKASEAKMLDMLMAQAKTTICEIGEEKISGDTAKLIVTIDGKPKPARFLKENGVWRIDAADDLKKLKGVLGFLKGLKALKKK